MLSLKYKILFTIVTFKTFANDIVSEEKTEQNSRNDKNTYSRVERRFFDNLDDETWHVSHLKDTDFSAKRGDCAGETFQEKVNKYRKSLQNDGALVEYVSADALPFNESDLVTDVCKIPDKKDVVQFALQSKKSTIDAPQQKPLTPISKSEVVKVESNEKNAKANISRKHGQKTLNIATTTTDKTKESSDKQPSGRKASEYQFSSIEYYDETFDFDSNICPNAVDEVILEVEHIRNYDMRCEQLLEWRSLE